MEKPKLPFDNFHVHVDGTLTFLRFYPAKPNETERWDQVRYADRAIEEKLARDRDGIIDKTKADLKLALEMPIAQPWVVAEQSIIKQGTDTVLLEDRNISDETLQLIADAMNFYVRHKTIEEIAR